MTMTRCGPSASNSKWPRPFIPADGLGRPYLDSNYMYNHIGHFAEAGEALCKALFSVASPVGFPTLKFGFLEGGVARERGFMQT